MIITVFSGNGCIEKSMLAVNLAALRAHSRHNVLLIDADTRKYSFLWSVRRGSGGAPTLHLPVLPVVNVSLHAELEHLPARCEDIIIDAGGTDEADTWTALIAASVVVIPVGMQAEDNDSEDRTIALLEKARIFNPRLRIVVVMLQPQHTELSHPQRAARKWIDRIPKASIGATLIHDRSSICAAFRKGLTIFEVQPSDELAMAEMESLGREVYGAAQVSPGMATNIETADAALRK